MRRARWAEAAGFDGITIVDSQNLSGDCYVALAMAAAATTRLKLGTGVTNPFTRYPAVTASAIATVQAVSDGRRTSASGAATPRWPTSATPRRRPTPSPVT